MESSSDVVVIGGGPCGSSVAYTLAKRGADVRVFEEHGEIGLPVHCPGHLSIKGLKNLGIYPLPDGICENTFQGAVIHSPGGKQLTIRLASPITCTVDRSLFDKHVAERAKTAGAHYCLNSHVDSLIVQNGFVKGVKVSSEGEIEMVNSRIVIDAEGISSRFTKQVGLTPSARSKLLIGLHAEVQNVENTNADMVEIFLGKDYAPGFYAWLIPKSKGKAKIGLAANSGNPKNLLDRLVHEHPVLSRKLSCAEISGVSIHSITLGGAARSNYSNGFLAVGDAVSHVKPTTGGGIAFGMTGAKIAAEVACEALECGSFSSTFLRKYQRQCAKVFGFDMKAMLEMRRLLDGLSDEALDKLVALLGSIGLDKALGKLEDTDFQGRSILRLLPNPRIAAGLGYLFYLYLLAYA